MGVAVEYDSETDIVEEEPIVFIGEEIRVCDVAKVFDKESEK